LETSVAGSVDHDWGVPLPVSPYVGQAEALRHRKVELDRSTLPRSLQHVADVEVDFWPVEGTIAGIDDISDVSAIERGLECRLCLLPHLLAPDALIRAGG